MRGCRVLYIFLCRATLDPLSQSTEIIPVPTSGVPKVGAGQYCCVARCNFGGTFLRLYEEQASLEAALEAPPSDSAWRWPRSKQIWRHLPPTRCGGALAQSEFGGTSLRLYAEVASLEAALEAPPSDTSSKVASLEAALKAPPSDPTRRWPRSKRLWRHDLPALRRWPRLKRLWRHRPPTLRGGGLA